VTVRRLSQTAGSAFWTATRCGFSFLAALMAAVTAASNWTYSEVKLREFTCRILWIEKKA
jgi:hypothetical protein